MKEIDEIINELQETYGYSIEEQNHIHDLIVDFARRIDDEKRVEALNTPYRSEYC